jgi:cyclic-di-GMP phosphodiesterase TipF (flagellum assembly factor)
VVACIMLISASIGAVLYLLAGLPVSGAAVCAIAAMTGIGLCSIVASRRSAAASSSQITELSRGIADLARQVGELGRRVAAMEGKVAEAQSCAIEAAAPLSAEIGEIGELIKQLAESVSAHELVLQGGALPGPTSPVGPAVPAAGAGPSSLAPSSPAGAGFDTRRGPDPRGSSAAASGRGGSTSSSGLFVGGIEPQGAESASEISVAEMMFPASAPKTGFRSLAGSPAAAVVRAAVEANRLEFHLQPIVTLPQRKARYYEALARLHAADGELLVAGDFLESAEAAGLMPRIDNLMLFRCVQVVRRLLAKKHDVGLFCNISASTLADAEFFPQFTEFMVANRAIAPALVFELTQAAYRALGPIENESLAALMNWGFRFSLDHVGDLRFEPRDLADRGFRFVKVPAGLLLGRHGSGASNHAADLSGLLSRFGIELIAEKIENETTVVDLLDFEVKYGQGNLFSPPRPVRPEVLQALLDQADSRTSAPGARQPAAPAPSTRAAGAAGAGAAVAIGGAAGAADKRLAEALQRSTALAQIARTVAAARSGK